jgi:DNA-binding CsgD family transcriptional regulator
MRTLSNFSQKECANQFLAVKFSFIMPLCHDENSLCFYHCDEPLLERLQYTVQEFETLGEVFFSKVVLPDDRPFIIKMARYLKQSRGATYFGDGFRLLPKKGGTVFIVWCTEVTSRHKDGSPKIFSCEGIILGNNGHLVHIMKA